MEESEISWGKKPIENSGLKTIQKIKESCDNVKNVKNSNSLNF